MLTLFLGCWLTLFTALNLNIWMVYFTYSFSYYVSTFEWQRVINPLSVEPLERGNWFVKHKGSWGSWRFATRFSIAVYFLLLLTVATANFVTINFLAIRWKFINKIGIAVVSLAPPSFFIAVQTRTPHFKDSFCIQTESRMFCRVVCVLIFVLPVWVLSVAVDNHIFLSLATLALELCFAAMIYASTGPVIAGNNRNDVNSRLSTDVSNAIELQHILDNKKALDLLMAHLHREYAPELLIALIELDQLHQYLMCKLKKAWATPRLLETATSTNLVNAALRRNKNVPISLTVSRNSAVLNSKGKCETLFKKYTKPGSELEINISSECRRQLNSAMARMRRPNSDAAQPSQAPNADAIRAAVFALKRTNQEMLLLLGHSLSRFKQTNEFCDVLDIFAKRPMGRVELAIEGPETGDAKDPELPDF